MRDGIIEVVIGVVVSGLVGMIITITVKWRMINYLKTKTSKNFRKDIANEKLNFLHFCEFQRAWRATEIRYAFNIYRKKFGIKSGLKSVERNFPEVFKPCIYAIYVNNELDKSFTPFYIGEGENKEIFEYWLNIVKTIKKNYKKTFHNCQLMR